MKINFTTFRQRLCLVAFAVLSFTANETKAQLSGTYTIGGIAPDYTTFTDAVTALSSALGISGPVVFNVRGPLTYTEQITIPEIIGASAVNTITFQSQSLDSSMVTLTFPSSSLPTNNYTVYLNGADYIIFNRITISRTGTFDNARVTNFENGATNNTITHCRIIGTSNSTLTNLNAGLVTSSYLVGNESYCTFTNNLFQGGSEGIVFSGEPTAEYGTTITNNQFVGQYWAAIDLTYERELVITGNTITTSSTASGYCGIKLDVCNYALTISKNKITGVPGTGIKIAECYGHMARQYYTNNFIQCRDTAGIFITAGGNNQDIAGNSINVTGAASSALLIADPGMAGYLGMTILDNALVNSGGGYSYAIRNAATGFTSNYNDLYTTGANVGNYIGATTATLADWQLMSSGDNNSVSMDPVYVSVTDLHATSGAFDNLGNLAGTVVPDDIDGETRLGVPDIGADEYSGLVDDVGITALISPVNNECESASDTIRVVLCNTGNYNEINIPVHVDVTGAGTFSSTVNVSSLLVPGDCDTITLGIINTTGGGVFNFHIYSSLSNDDLHGNDTLNLTITINAIPSAPTSAGITICQGQTAALTATAAVSTDTLIWYTAATGGTPIGLGSPFYVNSVTTDSTFYVEAKGFCASTRTAVNVIVNPLPVVNLGSDLNIIQGLNANLDAGAGFLGYLWSTGETTQMITITPTTDTCVWVRVSDINCNNYDTVCITLVFPTDAGVSTLLSPANGECESTQTMFEVVLNNYGTTPIYNIPVTVVITGTASTTFTEYYIDTILPLGNANFSFVNFLNTIGGGVYTITIYTGLATDQAHGNDTLVQIITINLPPAEPTASDVSRCGPGPITATAAADSVYWFDASTGGNLIGVGSNYTDPNLTDTVYIYAQAGLTCPSSTRKEVMLIVIPLPVIMLPADSVVECGDSITLDAGTGPFTYLWSNSEITQTVYVGIADTSDYWVVVTDTVSTCQNSDTIHVDCIVGYELLNIANNVSVYPNPSSGKVELNISIKSVSAIIIRWMNASGQIIKSDKVSNATSLVHRSYDLSNVAKGMYFVQIISSEGVVTKKVSID